MELCWNGSSWMGGVESKMWWVLPVAISDVDVYSVSVRRPPPPPLVGSADDETNMLPFRPLVAPLTEERKRNNDEAQAPSSHLLVSK